MKLVKGIDNSDYVPKYAQLREILVERIKNDNFNVGDRLCTESELKKEYQLSTATVVHSLKLLEQEGLVERRRGGGTFVKSKQVLRIPQKGEPVLKNLIICGMSPKLRDPLSNQNWFIPHEILRGITDNFIGKIQFEPHWQDLKSTLSSLSENERNVIISNPKDEVVDLLKSKQACYAMIDQEHKYNTAQMNTVGQERLPGVCNAMTYLIHELGHKNIAFITAKGLHAAQHRDRISGYAIGLQTFNIPYRDELVVKVSVGDSEAGENGVKELLRRKAEFTALFADTDLKAIGAIATLRKAGLRVPEDVSVMGFDDFPGADETDPPLTTIRIPLYEMGAMAVNFMKKRIATGNDVQGSIIPATLIKRASCKKR